MENFVFDKRRQQYLHLKQTLFSEYMQQESADKEQNLFFCLNSSTESLGTHQKTFSIKDLKTLLSNLPSDIHNGGYFLRWNQKGIAINPSTEFLQRFCKLGHHLWDIDYIIVTSPEQSAALELKTIHCLNGELNQTLVSYEQEPHVIQYLLHPAVYAQYAATLRPQFREEKNSLVCLETFQDGYGEERYELQPDIRLWYSKPDSSKEALMIRLEFGQEAFSFGYMTNAGWTDVCAPFFKQCNMLLLGFGQTNPEDLEKISVQTDCVGYSGLTKAIEELQNLQALFISEFCSSQGDIRLEVVKQLRKESDKQNVLPLEQGFMFNLDTLCVKTGMQEHPPYHFTPIEDVHVIQCEETFGTLIYLSKDNVM